MRRNLKIAGIVLAMTIAVPAALFVSLRPAVEQPARPSTRDMAAAREVWGQIEAVQRADTPLSVRFDSQALASMAVLASDATGGARFEGRVIADEAVGRTSIPLPAGLWINASVSIAGEHAGFPAYRLQVGRVRFPAFASRWIADLARLGFGLTDAGMPPLDDMVRRLSVDRGEVLAELALSPDSGVMDGLIAAGGHGVNGPLVAEIYCRIAAGQVAQPAENLSQLVRTTFDIAYTGETREYSRAALIALSFLVVGDRAEALAPRAAQLARNCERLARPIVLQGREDLALHWAFSAGLTVVLGKETAASFGEWKELDDSLAGGSGFSFVDLAAARSGMHAALRATGRRTAARGSAELARATEADLMPDALLQVPEGLTEASFVDRFGGLDRESYRSAVAAIDRVLTRQRARGRAETR